MKFSSTYKIVEASAMNRLIDISGIFWEDAFRPSGVLKESMSPRINDAS